MSETTTFTILDFFDKHKIPYVKIHIDTTGGGKKVSGMSAIKGWTTWDYDACMGFNANADPKCKHINVNINKSDFMIIDIDNPDLVEQTLQKYGDCYYTLSSSKKLPHLIRRKHPDDNNTTDCKSEDGIDYLYQNTFEKIDGEVYKCIDDIPVFTHFEKKEKETKKKRTKKIKKIVKKPFNFDPESSLSNEEREIILNIDKRYIGKYADWLKLIFALYNTFENIDLCLWFSRLHPDYKDIDRETIINKIESDSESSMTFGSVNYYSKISNEENYINIKAKYCPSFIDGTDDGLADFFLSLVGDSVIRCNNDIYVYQNPYWRRVGANKGILRQTIKTELKNAIKVHNLKVRQLIREAEDKEEDTTKLKEKQEGLFKLETKVKTQSKITSITTSLEDILFTMEKIYPIDGVKPYYFCFENVAFDLQTKQKVKVSKYDYITTHAGYNYTEPTQGDKIKVKNIIESIMPDKELRNSVLSVLRCGMIGILFEKFILFNGNGRNGKGVILEHFVKMLGNYGWFGNKNLLTKEIKTGANEELASLGDKRFVVFSEPEEGEKVNTGSMKYLTGNKYFSCRGLYEKDQEKLNVSVKVVECNSRPAFKGRMDDAIVKRVVDIPFTQTFTEDEEEIKMYPDTYHAIDKTLKNADYIEKLKCAWFKLLMDCGFDDIYEPIMVKIRTKNFIMGSDELLGWFNEYYVKTENKKDTITIKQVWNMFQQSDFYRQLSGADKRTLWNRTKFYENIECNVVLKQYCKTIQKVRLLTNYRLKTSEELEN